jgi:protein-S-isoprenylcysteine O-methyltransferase Ste14
VPDLQPWIYGVYGVFLVFWFAGAFVAKRTARNQSSVSALIQGALAAAGFALLFNRHNIGHGSLDWRIVPGSAAAAYAGFAITICGLGFAAWSRIVLGRNWSVTVTLKENHEFIRSGPYAFVRHPIYSGTLLAMVGTALYFGEVRGFFALLLTFSGYWLKSRGEEELMVEQFGAQYVQYQARVKMLIPFFL